MPELQIAALVLAWRGSIASGSISVDNKRTGRMPHCLTRLASGQSRDFGPASQAARPTMTRCGRFLNVAGEHHASHAEKFSRRMACHGIALLLGPAQVKNVMEVATRFRCALRGVTGLLGAGLHINTGV